MEEQNGGLSSPVSLTDGTLAGWKPAEAETPTSSIGEQLPASEPGILTLSTAGVADEPNVVIAFRWAKIYANDIEYRPFFQWIGDRSNSERTDFAQILESIPMRWGPDDLPPPLRRHFLRKFGR